MHLKRSLTLGTFLFVTGLTTATFAQTQPPSETVLAEARARFNEGIDFADKGDHESARLKFGQAWALMKSPTVLYNLARSEMLTGQNLQALEHFQQFLTMGSDPKVTEAQREKAAKNIDKLWSLVGRISVEVPEGARITVDNKPIEDNKSSVPVAPGPHVVEAVYKTQAKMINVNAQAGTITTAKLVFDPPKPAKDEIIEPPKEEPQGFWTTGRIVGAGVTGAGLVALGLGIGFGIASQDTKKDGDAIQNGFPEATRGSACNATPQPDGCARLRDLRNEQDTQAALSLGFYIGGAAAVVGGVVLFLVSGPSKRESPRALQLVPIMTAREGGLSVVGRF